MSSCLLSSSLTSLLVSLPHQLQAPQSLLCTCPRSPRPTLFSQPESPFQAEGPAATRSTPGPTRLGVLTASLLLLNSCVQGGSACGLSHWNSEFSHINIYLHLTLVALWYSYPGNLGVLVTICITLIIYMDVYSKLQSVGIIHIWNTSCS